MVTVLEAGSEAQVFVGIDWGGSEHQLCALDEHGQPLIKARLGHDVFGLSRLDQLLAEVAMLGPLRVAIERSEGILVEHLLAGGLEVFCVSPKISARVRERYRLANTKSDAFDAFVLADALRHEHRHWRPLSARSSLTAQITSLSRDRDRVLVMQRAAESRLRAALEAYHPAPLHLFSSLDRDITLAFIRDYPTPQAAARVGVERMARFCRRHGYSGRADPAVLVERMRPHLLAAAEGTTAGKQTSALLLVDQLELLNGHIRVYDQHLRELVGQHPDAQIFTSFPGVATVIAATFVAEIGQDRDRFPRTSTLLAEAGLAPVTRASGRTRQVRFRYAANHRLRHAIDWWMTVAAREDPWSRQVYDSARAAGQGRYRAYRGLGARWTRILWRCWSDHTLRPRPGQTRPDRLTPFAIPAASPGSEQAAPRVAPPESARPGPQAPPRRGLRP